MKRVLLLCLLAWPLFAAPEKWYEAYKRGVAAVNAKNYKAAESALQTAIAEHPMEGVGVRTRNEIVTYVPHFWMGIAKFNLGEVDAALREFRISEEQGAISKTDYYSTLKEWVARAQTEKKRVAQNAAAGAKNAAGAAINAAVAAQSGAVSAGGDHTDAYRAGSRKLQEALTGFPRAGTEIAAYEKVEETAKQAATLFATAADEAKKLKAARAAAPKPAPARVVPQPKTEPVQQAAAPPQKVEPKVETPPPAPVASAAESNARVAVQDYRRKLMDAAGSRTKDKPFQAFVRTEMKGADELRRQLEDADSDADFQRIANIVVTGEERLAKRLEEIRKPATPVVAATMTPQPAVTLTKPMPVTSVEDALRSAWRAYAAGDLDSSEQLLTNVLGTSPSGEAFLLRGCARYTRAMLSRRPDSLLEGASADFKAALARNRRLRLDERTFSPKLVAYFETIRKAK